MDTKLLTRGVEPIPKYELAQKVAPGNVFLLPLLLWIEQATFQSRVESGT